MQIKQNKIERIKNSYDELHHKNPEDLTYPLIEYFKLLDDLDINLNEKVVLDIGCGTGRFLQAINSKYSPSILEGIDISQEAIKQARGRVHSLNTRLITGSAEETDFGTYDYVFSLGSFEHCYDMNLVLRKILNSLHDENSRVILMVPNKRFPLWWFSKAGTKTQKDISESILSYHEWISLFESHGLKVERTLRDMAVLTRMPKIFRFFFKLLPTQLTYQVIYVLKPNVVKVKE